MDSDLAQSLVALMEPSTLEMVELSLGLRLTQAPPSSDPVKKMEIGNRNNTENYNKTEIKRQVTSREKIF